MLEIRQVTVLLCDLVGSTALTQRLDPEDAKAVIDAFHHIVDIETERFGVEWPRRYEGDGALAVFGYPSALEDAPLSAVRCGLALVKAIRAAAPAPEVQLDVRVGIAFGTVVLEGGQGAVWRDQSVVGTVPALAARLASAAPPGGVAIDHKLWRLVGRHVRCAELGALTLKGFEHGVRSWLALGETAESARPESVEGGLIGREAELSALTAAWRAAKASSGNAVLIQGDPGVGKSRLARAIADLAIADGGLQLRFECTPRTRNTPLYPLGVLLRQRAGISAEDDAQAARERARTMLAAVIEAARLDDAMHYLAPLFVAPESMPDAWGESAEQGRQRTMALILDVVAGLARRGPLLLLFEDLQWSDPTSTEVLLELVRRSATWKVLTVVTSRPELEVAMAGCLRIELLSLDPRSARALVMQHAEGEVLSDATIATIVERGEGVPLFLEQLTLTAMENVARPGTGAGASDEIPPLLQNVIQARLDRWTAVQGTDHVAGTLRREVTQAAAVLGREFALFHLHELRPGSALEVNQTVALLIDNGVMCPLEAGGRLRFKHALIHEAAYKTLLRSDRRRLHSRAAEIFAGQTAGTPDAAPDVIAYHLRAADRFEDAILCRTAAAADTLSRAAYLEAVAHCEAGLALAETLTDPLVANAMKRQLLVLMGVAQTALLGYAAAEVRSAYQRALELSDDAADPRLMYPIIRGLSTYFLVRGELAEAHRLSEQGRRLADSSQQAAHRIDALCVQAYTMLYTGRLVASRALLEQCLALYAAEDGAQLTYPVPQDAATGAWALLPTVAWLLGDDEGAEAAVQNGLAHVERLGRPFDTALLQAWTAGTRYTQRQFAEAQKHAAIAVETSQRYGYRDWYGTGQLMLALAVAAQQPAPEALSGAQQVMAAFDAQGVGLNASYYLWALARGLARVGNNAAARQALDQAFAVAAASDDLRMNAEMLLMQAELEDDAQRARERLDAALALAEQQGAVVTALRVALTIVLRGGDDQQKAWAASTAAALDAPWPARHAQPGWIALQLAGAKQAVQTMRR